MSFPEAVRFLDTPVTIPDGTRPLAEVVIAVLGQVGQATQQKIELAASPINFFNQRRVEIAATQEPARDVLVRALAASGRPLSWRLFYDVTMGRSYLGIHFVPPPSAPSSGK